jgi:hypothetical protein
LLARGPILGNQFRSEKNHEPKRRERALILACIRSPDAVGRIR